MSSDAHAETCVQVDKGVSFAQQALYNLALGSHGVLEDVVLQDDVTFATFRCFG